MFIFIYIYMESYSQSAQDIFVYTVLKEKVNGSFLEIGSNHPITHNNSYILEKKYNWKGLMIEYDSSFKILYDEFRKKSIYEINDARQVKYKEYLDKYFPTNIDYLQIDLDVDNKSTLDTLLLLNNTVFDNYRFATVTFEHDIYRGNYFDTREISRKIFEERGYVLVFPDVSVFFEGAYRQFEDWYVHPDLVDMEFIHTIMSNKSLTTDEIKTIFIQL